MAIEIDFQFAGRLTIPGAYLMVGEIRQNFFHETVEIDYYVFVSEDGRRQLLSDSEHDLHRPIKKLTIMPPISIYQKYLNASALSAEGMNPQKAAYDLALNESEPWGLKELVESGLKHGE